MPIQVGDVVTASESHQTHNNVLIPGRRYVVVSPANPFGWWIQDLTTGETPLNIDTNYGRGFRAHELHVVTWADRQKEQEDV